MIVVRDVFYLKFGAAKQALALIEKAKDIMKKDSFMPWRVLTDFTGHSYTLILESDIIDISSYNEADTRARIDAFIDTLASVKK